MTHDSALSTQHPDSVWGRDFTLYLLGVTGSLTGVWLRIVAQSWLVYRLTESPWLLGVVGFFAALPVLAVSPVAGVLIDRVDRRTMLALTQAGQLLVIVALALLDGAGLITVWQVMALALVGGVVASFDWPTRLSLVPNLVEPRHLPQAVALNSAAWNGARIGGPVLAGLVLPVLGTAGAFWTAAAVTLPVLLLWPFIRVRAAQPPSARGGSFRGDLGSGYAYVLSQPVLRTLLLLPLAPVVLGQTLPTLMPVFAAEALGAGSRELGWLLAALGAGTLGGTLTIALTALVPRRPLSVLVGVSLFGLLLVAFAQSRSLVLSLACLALAGLAGGIYETLDGALLQQATDDRYRGRVNSVVSMSWGLTPLGNIELGGVAQLAGAQTAVAVNGALIVAVSVALARLPLLRQPVLAVAEAAPAAPPGSPPARP